MCVWILSIYLNMYLKFQLWAKPIYISYYKKQRNLDKEHQPIHVFFRKHAENFRRYTNPKSSPVR